MNIANQPQRSQQANKKKHNIPKIIFISHANNTNNGQHATQTQ